MAALNSLLLLAVVGFAHAAAPVRNPVDCVSSNLLNITGNVYPSTHQITRQSIQERTTVTFVQEFKIAYGNTYKIVTIARSDTNETYLLYQCGTTKPVLSQIGLPANTKVFSVPLQAVSVADTTAMYFMDMLGVKDRVSYVTPYVVDPCMQLLSSSVCGGRSSDNAPADAVDGKFDFYKDANVSNSIMISVTAELGPLHAAEYIKYVAAFFNREAVANRAFTAVYNAYTELAASVLSYKTNNNVASPVVAWLYYQAKYSSSPEQIQIKFHSFRVQYTEDAGGVLPNLAQLKTVLANYTDVKVNTVGDLVLYNLNSTNTAAALRTILANVNIVIDESYVPGNVSQYTVASFLARYRLNESTAATDFKFLRTQNGLLRLDGTANAMGTTAWFEEAVARPDVVLHDLVTFIMPAVLQAANDKTAPRLVRSLIPVAPSTTSADGLLTLSGSGATVLTLANCPLQRCGSTIQPICPAVYLDCSVATKGPNKGPLRGPILTSQSAVAWAMES
ncbi:hypothetical protein VOLCADRAFT_106039 [Volvox carteri f. nagariensis]|uniref:Secreted protein n=1 Tax=Volvox carteri f. nagariensis TaxID=3068 RepID=D8U4P7_VOLCA|nr:uncharacterized protein VOLCADRAFT_106039 [Volvox carteri f. nagariensis]EFJ45225.1 hypothetical protein VOLCADRAFT_106039 [Volvox carteri f. nagariensis]|eukprot:XP_002953601.1 hypothetical protein VOLCADRAFT_106039 [Volvox carteri f. nagariensis]